VKADEITLVDERGEERPFLLHDAVDLDGFTYYLVEAADDPDEVILLKEVGDGLESIDGEELARVLASLEEEEKPG
jgi:hypothetical protein